MVARLTLVVGAESLLVERAVADVVASARQLDPDAEKRVLSADQDGVSGQLAEACSPTLFGGGAVVIVESAESASSELVDEIVNTARKTDFPMVVIHAGGAKGKAHLKTLDGVADVRIECFEIKKGRALAEFVGTEVRRRGRRISPQAVPILLAAVGNDLRDVVAAVSQLCDDVEAPEIDVDHVNVYFGGTAEVTGFQIADAVVNRQPSQAIRLLRLAEVNDGSRVGPAMVASLTNAFRQLIAVAGAPQGLSERDLAARAKAPPWKLRAINGQLRYWNQRELAAALLVLADTDAAMKGGLREGEQLEPAQKGLLLERTITELATRS